MIDIILFDLIHDCLGEKTQIWSFSVIFTVLLSLQCKTIKIRSYCFMLNYKFEIELKDINQSSSEVEGLPTLSEFFNRNSMRWSSHQKILSHRCNVKIKALNINNFDEP